jgi:hypothetical protein
MNYHPPDPNKINSIAGKSALKLASVGAREVGLVPMDGAWVRLALVFGLLLSPQWVWSQTAPVDPRISGAWVLNIKESDDPDKKVERAIRDVGGRPDADGKSGRGRYKGGPKEQEIYDHLIYDETLNVTQSGPEIRMEYADGFARSFFTDGRGRTVSASGSASGDTGDFAFGAWAGNILNVEAKPRDGGWTQESYTVDPETGKLHVALKLKPLLFPAVVEAQLVYDRQPAKK